MGEGEDGSWGRQRGNKLIILAIIVLILTEAASQRLLSSPPSSPLLTFSFLSSHLISSPPLSSPYLSSPLLTFPFLSSPLPFPPVPLLSSYPLIIPAAVSLLINFSVLSRAPDCSSPQTALRSVLLLPRSYSRSPLPVSHLASNECRG